MLAKKDAWTLREVQKLIKYEFDVEYSEMQVWRILTSWNMHHAVLLHPVVVGHFGRSIDIGFTGPPPQDSTEPRIHKFKYMQMEVGCMGIKDCYFYHTTDLPGYGIIYGEWDLRDAEAAYLGNVDFDEKKVLEIGTASGHLCFWMERQGAEVTAYDLSEKQEWDIVPYAKYDYKQLIAERKKHISKINNSFWLSHQAFGSKAKMIYGTVYDIPEDIGVFDIVTMGSILLNLRDPFLALQNAAAHSKEKIIITDLPSSPEQGKILKFLPDVSNHLFDTWWQISPDVVIEIIKILGFQNTYIKYHTQLYRKVENNKAPEYYPSKLYTIVGSRQ